MRTSKPENARVPKLVVRRVKATTRIYRKRAIDLVDRTGRYSNRSTRTRRPRLLDLLIRCERELAGLAALLRLDGEEGT